MEPIHALAEVTPVGPRSLPGWRSFHHTCTKLRKCCSWPNHVTTR